MDTSVPAGKTRQLRFPCASHHSIAGEGNGPSSDACSRASETGNRGTLRKMARLIAGPAIGWLPFAEQIEARRMDRHTEALTLSRGLPRKRAIARPRSV